MKCGNSPILLFCLKEKIIIHDCTRALLWILLQLCLYVVTKKVCFGFASKCRKCRNAMQCHTLSHINEICQLIGFLKFRSFRISQLLARVSCCSINVIITRRLHHQFLTILFIIRCTRSSAVFPFFPRIKMKIFPISGVALNSRSINTVPKKPVDPVMNTFFPDRNSAMLGFVDDTLSAILMQLFIRDWCLIRDHNFRKERLNSSTHQLKLNRLWIVRCELAVYVSWLQFHVLNN